MLERKYESKDGLSSAVRVFLDSKTWTPTQPGVLGFDAMIKECGDSTRVKIANRALADLPTDEWLVGACNRFEINGMDDAALPNVMIEMVAIIDPDMGEELAKAEGVRVEEIGA
jgi:hypothetical protein